MFNIIYVGLYYGSGTLWIFTTAWNASDLQKAQTLGLTTMAMFQLFNALKCRSKTKSVFRLGLTTNKYLLSGLATSFSLQVFATLLPSIPNCLRHGSPSYWEWAKILLVSSSVFFAEELRKLIINRIKR